MLQNNLKEWSTCGCWFHAGEVLVALRFDFIQDEHLLLRRQGTVEPHL